MITTGTTIGEISTVISSALPRNSARVRPTAARVPRTTASKVAAGAMSRLFFSERIQSAEVNSASYQRNENPCSG